MKNIHVKISLFLILTCLSFTLAGQNATAPEPTLNSPYNTIYVHLYYLQADSYQPKMAAKAMHPDLDSTLVVKRAIRLKQILDGKGLYVTLNTLPQEEDYVDSLTNKAYYTPFRDALPEVYLERVNDRWYYSMETMEAIPTLHRKVYPLGADFLVHLLPKNASSKALGLQLWQWLGIALILLLCYLLHFLLSRILRPFIKLLAKSRINFEFITIKQLSKLAGYLSMILIAWMVRLVVPALQFGIKTSAFVQKSITIFMIVVTTLIMLLIINVIMDRAKVVALKTESTMDEQLIPLLSRVIKIVIVIIAIISILRTMNVNVTALIAGISIGGLALALAAQDTVKNLIGSIMIFIDKPFQMGDYVVGNDFEGSVEEIGFRTTRIRTIDTSIIAVPNGVIANMSVKNLGVRTYRMFDHAFGLTYSTTPEQITQFVDRLKEMITTHPNLHHENFYVHFKEMADFSLNIMFRCYLAVGTYGEELAIKEQLLLKVMKIAEELDVSFAFPSTSLYIEQGP